MMRYASLRRRPACFRAFTGLAVEEFERLIAETREDWVRLRIERLDRPDRIRTQGGGAKPKLDTLEDQLLLVLVWARLYLVYLALEYLFGIDESTVSRTIRHTLPLLRGKFMLPERLPQKKVRTLEELKKYLPPDINLDEFLTDATEQRIPRPVKKRKRKPYQSGKKRAFTLKTQIATNRKGYILHVSPTVGGRMHDYKLFQHSGLPNILPDGSRLIVDLGYEGARKDYGRLSIWLPTKRHRWRGALTRSEKIRNKKQRRARIRVENALAKLKKFNVLSGIYRHAVQNYNDTFGFVANVVNFRMRCRLQAA